MKTELTDLIEKHIHAIAKDMRLIGIKLREDKLFLESILIFDAASTLSEKIENPVERLDMIRFCVQGMKDTNKAIISDNANMKVIVKEYVIPLMRDKLHDIESTSSVSEQYKCLHVCRVLHYIQFSQYWVDQPKQWEQTLRDAKQRMDEVFGDNKIKHQVYGTLLNNLGLVSLMTFRHKEAVSFFKQALGAFKAATDYDDEEVRKYDTELYENGLKIAQQQIRWIVM